jgi:hypothetical protein
MSIAILLHHAGRILQTRPAFRAANTGQGFGIAGAEAFPLCSAACAQRRLVASAVCTASPKMLMAIPDGAALQREEVARICPILVIAVLAIPIGLHFLGAWLEPSYPWAGKLTRDVGYLSVFAALLLYLKNYLKIAPSLPGYGFFRRLATLHFTRPKHEFYDTTLNVNVGYAKHAISIDENRADFARVKWNPTAEKLN